MSKNNKQVIRATKTRLISSCMYIYSILVFAISFTICCMEKEHSAQIECGKVHGVTELYSELDNSAFTFNAQEFLNEGDDGQQLLTKYNVISTAYPTLINDLLKTYTTIHKELAKQGTGNSNNNYLQQNYLDSNVLTVVKSIISLIEFINKTACDGRQSNKILSGAYLDQDSNQDSNNEKITLINGLNPYTLAIMAYMLITEDDSLMDIIKGWNWQNGREVIKAMIKCLDMATQKNYDSVVTYVTQDSSTNNTSKLDTKLDDNVHFFIKTLINTLMLRGGFDVGIITDNTFARSYANLGHGVWGVVIKLCTQTGIVEDVIKITKMRDIVGNVGWGNPQAQLLKENIQSEILNLIALLKQTKPQKAPSVRYPSWIVSILLEK